MDKEPIPLLPRWSTLLFLRRFIAQPGQIGSVAPSSHFLVQEMLKLTDWGTVTNVAELGAGTGVVTEALLRKISPNAGLSVFELDRKLREKSKTGLKSPCSPTPATSRRSSGQARWTWSFPAFPGRRSQKKFPAKFSRA